MSLSAMEDHLHLLIIPTIYGAVSILLGLGITVIAHHFPDYEYGFLMICLLLVLFEMGFFAGRAMLYIPMMWIWSLWLILRFVNMNADSDTKNTFPVFDPIIYLLFDLQQIAVSLLSFISLFRQRWPLFLITMLSAGVHIARKDNIDELDTVKRLVCFILCYYLSLVITACSSVTDGRRNNGVVNVIQSKWCLFIFNPGILLLATVIQAMVAAAFIFKHAHILANISYTQKDGMTTHTDAVKPYRKTSSSQM